MHLQGSRVAAAIQGIVQQRTADAIAAIESDLRAALPSGTLGPNTVAVFELDRPLEQVGRSEWAEHSHCPCGPSTVPRVWHHMATHKEYPGGAALTAGTYPTLVIHCFH